SLDPLAPWSAGLPSPAPRPRVLTPHPAAGSPPPASPPAASSPRRHRGLVAGVVAIVLVAIGVAVWAMTRPTQQNAGNPTPPPTDPNRSPTPPPNVNPNPGPVPVRGVILRGGGSTFVEPLMGHWAGLYEKQTGVKVEYVAGSSTKGVAGLED